MRAFLPFAVFLLLVDLSPAAETSAEIANQLLKKLAAAEAAALKEKPPGNDRVAELRRAATVVREHLGNEHASPRLPLRDDDFMPQLRQSLSGFPDLAKLAEQWNKTHEEEGNAWEKDACAEMEKVMREAVAQARIAQAPGELDGSIASLSRLVGKYQYDPGANTWPGWVSCARQVTDVLSFVNQLQSVLAAEKDGQRREALDRLRGLFRRDTVPGLSGSDLRALLNERAQKLGLPSTDEAEKAVREMVAKAMAATKPAELDPLLEQVNRMREVWVDVRSRDQETRTLSRLTEVGREFVVKWQDFLVERASGELDRARSTLGTLVRTAESEPVYPRALLLETSAALKTGSFPGPGGSPAPASDTAKLEQLLTGVKTLDDLVAQLPAIKAAIGTKTPGDYHTVVSDLERIQEGYSALRGGDLNRVKTATGGGFNKHPKVPELRAQLVVRLAAVVFHGENTLGPQEGEVVNQYVLRLMADAQQRKDWNRLKQIMETVNQYSAFSGIVSHDDSVALRSFLAGRNLDSAGVWPAAVSAYIQALKSGSSIVPADEITQRISAIRSEHPDDYQRGSELATPPPPKTTP